MDHKVHSCARTAINRILRTSLVVLFLFNTLFPSGSFLHPFPLRKMVTYCQRFLHSNARLKLKNLAAGPSAKSCQTILYLQLEIKRFSRLSGHSVYVFSVTRRSLSSSYHRPHGLSPACT